ncbi:hypothetical protein KQI63_07945 [bacterium]|nr:hypothetical protein [bacterium]
MSDDILTSDTPTDLPNLVGQQRQKEVVLRAVRTDRIPHAYLFLGPLGVGKEAAALDLARALLCLSHHRGHGTTPAQVPCGDCPSCAQTNRLAHPNLKVLFPLPKPKKSSGDEQEDAEAWSDAQRKQIEEALAAKAKDAYSPLNVQGGSEILIEQIRVLRGEFRLTSFSGGWRVVVISQADRLRVQAANAFLKLLEEPPDNVLFLLTSSRESKLLQTIISRCQILRFPPLPEDVLTHELIGRRNVAQQTAEASARLAGGSWSQAIRWAEANPAAEMEKAVKLLRSLVKGDPGVLDGLVEEWSAPSKSEEFGNLLLLLGKWIRDVQRLDANPSGHPELAKDSALAKFTKFTEGRDHARAIELIEEARLDLERNVQPGFVAHHLFVHLWRQLFARQDSTV